MQDRPPIWRRALAVMAALAVAALGVTLRGGRPAALARLAETPVGGQAAVPAAASRAGVPARRPELQGGLDRERLLAQGWGRPQPPRLIRPTYWPFVLGLGITFLLGGIATRFLISGVGLLIFALGLIGWITDLLGEQADGDAAEAEQGR